MLGQAQAKWGIWGTSTRGLGGDRGMEAEASG